MKAFVEGYLKEYAVLSLIIIDTGSQAIAGNLTYRPFFNNPNWNYFGLYLKKGTNTDIVVKDPYMWDEIEYALLDASLALEHVIYILKTKPITVENIRLIGKFLKTINKEDRALIRDELSADIPSLKQFAHLSEKEKA